MRLCQKCGVELDDAAEFCAKCGTKVDADDINVQKNESDTQKEVKTKVRKIQKMITGGSSSKKSILIVIASIVLIALISVILFAVIGNGNTVTLEDLITIKEYRDVVEIFGEPDGCHESKIFGVVTGNDYSFYCVSFLGKDLFLNANVLLDNASTSLYFAYYPHKGDIVTYKDYENLKSNYTYSSLTRTQRNDRKQLFEKAYEWLTDRYGEPSVRGVGTDAQYNWTTKDGTFFLYSYDNEDMGVLGYIP